MRNEYTMEYQFRRYASALVETAAALISIAKNIQRRIQDSPFLKLETRTHTELSETWGQTYLSVGGGARRPSGLEHSAEIVAAGSANCIVGVVYFADRDEASPGDTITFTLWVINGAEEVVAEVIVLPRSFTNAGMESLTYTSAATTLSSGPLSPGETWRVSFTYEVTANDSECGGELISAMFIHAYPTIQSDVWIEADALVRMRTLR